MTSLHSNISFTTAEDDAKLMHQRREFCFMHAVLRAAEGEPIQMHAHIGGEVYRLCDDCVDEDR